LRNRLYRFFQLNEGLCDRIFPLLLLFTTGFRVAWLQVPEKDLVFDEAYYVNAARKILSLLTSASPEGDSTYSYAVNGFDPNTEHPPLAKLIIAAFMEIFGDFSWSFRLPSVIMGVLAVTFLYLLVKKISGPRVAFFSAFLYSCENLTFIHSRIATLDIYTVAFMVMGFYFHLDRKMLLSAAFIALSSLSKIVGLLGLGSILAYSTIVELGAKDLKTVRLKKLGMFYRKYLAVFFLMFLGLLWVTDANFVLLDNHHPNPIEHLSWISKYSLKLGVGGYAWNGHVLDLENKTIDKNSIASPPWAWLINEKKIVYYRLSVQEEVDGKVVQRETAAFHGAMNPILIASMIPSTVYLAHTFLKRRDEFSLFLIVWWLFTYIVYYPLAFMNRVLYIFYMCPVMPMVCASTSLMMHRLKLPGYILLAYSSSTFMAFIFSFPVMPFA